MTSKFSRKKSKIVSHFLPLLFFLAIFFVGVAVNEPQRVLEQAWNICLDCIGIG
jgi:hypothetical protein